MTIDTKFTVAIIDENKSMREILGKIFKSMGFNVEKYENSAAVIPDPIIDLYVINWEKSGDAAVFVNKYADMIPEHNLLLMDRYNEWQNHMIPGYYLKKPVNYEKLIDGLSTSMEKSIGKDWRMLL